MITEKDCMKIIFETFSELERSSKWKEHHASWRVDGTGLCWEMSTFGLFVTDILNETAPMIDIKKLFILIEKLMVEGDQTVRNAVATCFLEDLLNYDSAGRIKASSFIHLLGPESRAYCKAWDEFTGVKTPGLWD